MARVVWSDAALDQPARVKTYLQQFDPQAAERIATGLMHLGESLRDYPNRGRPATNGAREMVTVRPYGLRYSLVADVVLILGIRHGAQQPVDDQ